MDLFEELCGKALPNNFNGLEHFAIKILPMQWRFTIVSMA
jgi:hypothetical protein